jgi:hypothetical protein
MARLRDYTLDRGFQALLIVSTIGVSWLGMMALHEAGHVLNGWLSGARLAGIYLPVVGFSRTDFVANPHPLFVAWGGAVWGCLLPLLLLAVIRLFVAACSLAISAITDRSFMTGRYVCLLTWFTGFCWIANGAYLMGGALICRGGDDAGVILQHGGAKWQVIAFSGAAVAAGLYLWNGLGLHFDLGPARGKVDRKAAIGMAIVLALTAAVELLAGRR